MYKAKWQACEKYKGDKTTCLGMKWLYEVEIPKSGLEPLITGAIMGLACIIGCVYTIIRYRGD